MTVDPAWVDGVRKLPNMPVPTGYGGVRVHRWRQACRDADEFLLRWAEEAQRLGWTTLDLFGCNCLHPYSRIDHAGLVPLLNGLQVVEITAEAATIRDQAKVHTRFYRRPSNPEQVALWDLR